MKTQKSETNAKPNKKTNTLISTTNTNTISIDKISKNALSVIYTLQQAGFQAYLVGGGVRDMLLGLNPKDFDIATDAEPDEVNRLFRNCRLIGRRFRLAHILFGREIIEVATFRGTHEEDSHSSHQRPVDYRQASGHTKDGLIVRDNVYGSLEEDAERRDFTINALYFDPSKEKVIDYAQGQDDIEQSLIRVIGDPGKRFQEDPVRMIRAIRFAAKLNFQVEDSAQQQIAELGHLLGRISPARLFDESLKLLQGGYGVRCFEELLKFDLFTYLFPSVQDLLHDKKKSQQVSLIVNQALENTDKRIGIGKSVNPAFILAVLLWYPMLRLMPEFREESNGDFDCMLKASQAVIKRQQPHTSIPKRLSFMVKDIWFMQSRLQLPTKKTAWTVLTHKRFRAAYDFLELRIMLGESQYQESFQWWTEIQEKDEQQQKEMISALAKNQPKRKSLNKTRKIQNDS